MQNLFAYGTLIFPKIRKGLTGKSFKTEKSLLKGYKRCAIYGCDYPAVIPFPDSAIRGQLIIDVDKRSLEILAFFEGTDYKQIEVEVFVGNNKVIATMFAWKSELDDLAYKDWDIREFEQNSLPIYIDKIIPETLIELKRNNPHLYR